MCLRDFLDPPDLRTRNEALERRRAAEGLRSRWDRTTIGCGILLAAFLTWLFIWLFTSGDWTHLFPGHGRPTKYKVEVHNATAILIYVRSIVAEEDALCRDVGNGGVPFQPGQARLLGLCYNPSFGKTPRIGYLQIEAYADAQGERRVFYGEYTWAELQEAHWKIRVVQEETPGGGVSPSG